MEETSQTPEGEPTGTEPAEGTQEGQEGQPAGTEEPKAPEGGEAVSESEVTSEDKLADGEQPGEELPGDAGAAA